MKGCCQRWRQGSELGWKMLYQFRQLIWRQGGKGHHHVFACVCMRVHHGLFGVVGVRCVVLFYLFVIITFEFDLTWHNYHLDGNWQTKTSILIDVAIVFDALVTWVRCMFCVTPVCHVFVVLHVLGFVWSILYLCVCLNVHHKDLCMSRWVVHCGVMVIGWIEYRVRYDCWSFRLSRSLSVPLLCVRTQT